MVTELCSVVVKCWEEGKHSISLWLALISWWACSPGLWLSQVPLSFSVTPLHERGRLDGPAAEHAFLPLG